MEFMNLIQSRAHGAEIPNAFVIIIAPNNVHTHSVYRGVYTLNAPKSAIFATTRKVKAAQIGAYHQTNSSIPPQPPNKQMFSSICFTLYPSTVASCHIRIIFRKHFHYESIKTENFMIMELAVRLQCQAENYYWKLHVCIETFRFIHIGCVEFQELNAKRYKASDANVYMYRVLFWDVISTHELQIVLMRVMHTYTPYNTGMSGRLQETNNSLWHTARIYSISISSNTCKCI